MLSIPHILLVLLVVLILFGAGQLPKVMGDFGKGLRNFRQGIKGEEEPQKKLDDSDQDKRS